VVCVDEELEGELNKGWERRNNMDYEKEMENGEWRI